MPVVEIPISNPPMQKRKLFYWAAEEKGCSELESWIAKQEPKERGRLAQLLRICFSHREPSLHPSEKKFKAEFRNKGQMIYAIKSYQIRLYGVLEGVDFYVFHFMIKKKDELNKDEKKAISAKHHSYLEKNEYAKKWRLK
ncbi:hypothetical protein [Desulfovibrio desulfuricans]|uniref:hypothetical protein n=1 Tax=Desulfovibrio desulfuricans TaxID=876 RepID=UPI001C01DA62|nr:hypothetical protein [Desulfovibrio desulfuricans]MBT9748629.1 hypothetical protein [Desulfovibrio desulfuricans]